LDLLCYVPRYEPTDVWVHSQFAAAHFGVISYALDAQCTIHHDSVRLLGDVQDMIVRGTQFVFPKDGFM
jgi:hypothetical protein